MTYSKEKILSIVQDFLGNNPTGVYAPSSDYEYGISDLPAVSKLNFDDVWTIEGINGFDIYRGATKVVISPYKSDYVIKLNITGTYLTEDECKEVGLEYPYIDRVSKQDILDEEIALYENVGDELKAFIKPNIFIGRYNGIPVYIQEKVFTTYEYTEWTISQKFRQQTPRHKQLTNRLAEKTIPAGWRSKIFPEAFISDMILAYGVMYAWKILTQISEAGISDLNYGNFGYDKNGLPCLIDIGDFCEEEFFCQDVHFYDTDWTANNLTF